jgi:hypothetical protein
MFLHCPKHGTTSDTNTRRNKKKRLIGFITKVIKDLLHPLPEYKSQPRIL